MTFDLTLTHHNAVRCSAQEVYLPTKHEDDRLIDEALDLVAQVKSSYRAADLLGISDSSVRRYRKCREKGLPYPELQQEMRDALRRATGVPNAFEKLVSRMRNERVSQPAKPDFDPDAPAATMLLQFLESRVGEDELAGELVETDLIATAYVLGRRHGFSAEDFGFLDYLRTLILEPTGEGEGVEPDPPPPGGDGTQDDVA